MSGTRKARRNDEGSALFVALVMAVLMAGILGALSVSTVSRSNVAARSNLEIERMYIAQAGIERIKMAVVENTGGGVNWLADIIAAKGPDTPIHSFNIGEYTVETFAEDMGTNPLDPWLTWYLLRARATDAAGRVTELGITTQLMDSFGKYAVFTDKDLNIGDFARYAGDVHSNEDVGIKGHHITFLGNLTAHGSIWFGNANAQKTCTFAKNAVPFVPKIPRPTILDIEEMRDNPPKDSLFYDWEDPDFQQKFKTATGREPNDTLSTVVEIDRNKMNVTNWCKVGGDWYKMEETGVDVPNNNIIYSAGNVYLEGHLSRRVSVFTPKAVTFTGPVRYVDDSDQPQYIVYKNNDQPANFNESDDMWAPVVNWKSSNMDYREADDWVDRVPIVDGKAQNPVLGVVAGTSIYVDNEDKDFPKNVEIHAMIYSADDVFRPKDTWDPNGHNLVILGGRVQVASSPNSGAWQFRHYIYDEHLRSASPPGFPTLLNPKFSNWHLRQM